MPSVTCRSTHVDRISRSKADCDVVHLFIFSLQTNNEYTITPQTYAYKTIGRGLAYVAVNTQRISRAVDIDNRDFRMGVREEGAQKFCYVRGKRRSILCVINLLRPVILTS